MQIATGRCCEALSDELLGLALPRRPHEVNPEILPALPPVRRGNVDRMTWTNCSETVGQSGPEWTLPLKLLHEAKGRQRNELSWTVPGTMLGVSSKIRSKCMIYDVL